MDLLAELKQRFEKAIAANIRPPILVGPNWVRACPDGQPADFEFIGAPRIAKATQRDPVRVAKWLLDKMDLAGLPVTVRVTPDGMIHLRVTSGPADTGAAPPAAKVPADTPAAGGPTPKVP